MYEVLFYYVHLSTLNGEEFIDNTVSENKEITSRKDGIAHRILKCSTFSSKSIANPF